MSQLFPSEIIEFPAERYYSKFRVHSQILYLVVLFSITTVFSLLSVIKVDISTQSRGVARTPAENTLCNFRYFRNIAE